VRESAFREALNLKLVTADAEQQQMSYLSLESRQVRDSRQCPPGDGRTLESGKHAPNYDSKAMVKLKMKKWLWLRIENEFL
jgi:hypothetical protein